METGACYCELEPCDVYRETIVMARKVHLCDECLEEIPKGSRYVRVAGLFEGAWSNAKRCVPCQSIARDYCCLPNGSGTVFTAVLDLLGVNLRTGQTIENPK